MPKQQPLAALTATAQATALGLRTLCAQTFSPNLDVPHEDGVRRAMTHAGRALEGEMSRHTSAMVSDELLALQTIRNVNKAKTKASCVKMDAGKCPGERGCKGCRGVKPKTQERSRTVTEDK